MQRFGARAGRGRRAASAHAQLVALWLRHAWRRTDEQANAMDGGRDRREREKWEGGRRRGYFGQKNLESAHLQDLLNCNCMFSILLIVIVFF